MNLTRIQLDEIYEHLDPYAIKNFIISDEPLSFPKISANYPFSLDCIAFAICINGNARLNINFKEFPIEKNTIITIFPEFVVEFTERSEDLMLEFLIFSTDFITEIPSSSSIDIYKSIIQNPCLKISDEEAKKYLEYHSFIVKQYKRNDHPFRVPMAKVLLFSLLIEVGAIYYNKMKDLPAPEENKSNSYQDDMIYKFFKLLLKHHREEKSLNFYADKMCLTPKYLSTVIKEKTGRTAFSWINEALISSIKYMLKTSDKTILQISDEMNFPNPSFFGRFFKKHTGLTPVQYRES